MANLIKYRVHEVAKDFKTTSKVISAILKEYTSPPKNHMYILEEKELDIIFEYLTQHNQIENMESIFAEAQAKAPEVKAEPVQSRPRRRSLRKPCR